MRRRAFLKTAAVTGFTAGAVAQPAKRLNFVFILIDDLGWRDVGFNGTRFYRTPNIDALAARGMRFSNAYAAAPVGSPTRASILTGKYPARHGVTNSLPGHHALDHSRLRGPDPKQFLPLEEVTLAEELKSAGYVTASIGKWHLGGIRYYPEKQGFDINIGGTDSGAPRSHVYPKWSGNPPIDGQLGEYLSDRLTRAAEDFIRSQAQHPFFLYVAHYGVHHPFEGRTDVVARYRRSIRQDDPQNNPTYAAMIENVDESVGRLVKKVEEEGLTENTVFIVTSDNGGLDAAEVDGQLATSNVPLKGGKGYLYEGGIRTPLCIFWPGVTKARSISSVPVISTDFYPTLGQMAGISRNMGRPVDGVSLVPLLQGTAPLRRTALYWHYPHYSTQGGRPGAAIRQHDFKLILWYEDQSVELYNLNADPGEKTNVAESDPARTSELKASLKKWLDTMPLEMPVSNADYDPERETEGLAQAIREQLQNGELPSPSRKPE
ncbi:MAG: N-acetylgalactosamine 6-sulfate sulfatase [Bryobacterales bacterium]|nr:N-acetylgalactosamine 6-sulfate sulfatase [Bryobacterales bacterium]